MFDPDLVQPPLTEADVLDAFRQGSELVMRSFAEIETKGLIVVPVLGTEPLPERLRKAHLEIRSPPGMTRQQFKQALKELE